MLAEEGICVISGKVEDFFLSMKINASINVFYLQNDLIELVN